jgi:hypothetical protein
MKAHYHTLVSSGVKPKNHLVYLILVAKFRSVVDPFLICGSRSLLCGLSRPSVVLIAQLHNLSREPGPHRIGSEIVTHYPTTI